MTEHSVDNTIDYTKSSGLKVLAFFCIFIIFGIGTVFKFDTYFTDFWKIRHCDPTPYTQGYFMWECEGIKIDRYGSGAIFLGIQKDAIKSAKNADVIIFGNSRTSRSFSTSVIDEYFKNKGLTYAVFTSEAASYKSSLITMERFNLKPKIIMVNHEIFYTDLISPQFRDLVDFPEKYKTRFTFFYNAQRVQKWACQSNIKWLKNYYCSGTVKGNWRSARTASLKWDIVAPQEDQVLIKPVPDFKIHMAGQMVTRSRELLEFKGQENTCPVWYIVNSPKAATNALKVAETELGIQTIYKEVPELYSYDDSHLDRPNSEKWAKEFIKVLDPAIDICLSGGGRYTPKVEDVFDINTADIRGISDFESWSIRDGATVTNATARALNKTMTADTFTTTKAGVNIQKIYRSTPIKAGMTMTFGAWFWSEDEMDIQLRIIKSCSRDTPLVSWAKSFTLSPTPKRAEVSYTFKSDHDCALIRIVGLKAGKTFNAWQAQVDYKEPQTKSDPLQASDKE